MIRCVAFDFDGTLVLSNAIKRDGFFAAVADYPGGAAAMEDLLVDPPGDRFAIMAAFAARFNTDAGNLVTRYTSWCGERILVCPERAGASALLQELRRRHLKIYVNSATPEAPLREVIAKRYPPGTFDGVFGGHGAKTANLATIAAQEKLLPKDILMVGDGADDYAATKAFGCAFAGVAEGTLAVAVGHGPLVADLSALSGLLAEIPVP